MFRVTRNLCYSLILIKSANITPKKRWQQKVLLRFPIQSFNYYHYHYKTCRKQTMAGRKALAGVRYKFKTKLVNYFSRSISIAPLIGFSYGFSSYPLKEFLWCKTLFNQVFPFLPTELSYPGFKFYPLSHIQLTEINIANQIVPLEYVPINTLISFVFDKNNRSMTYAKSSGSNAIKRKHTRKVKLAYVTLPSDTLKLLPLYTNCLLSTTKNLLLHKIIEGGWGFYTKQKKKINVRGVAMNPVDHPNGGRTKAKQPELSPWGWIAKRNK